MIEEDWAAECHAKRESDSQQPVSVSLTGMSTTVNIE